MFSEGIQAAEGNNTTICPCCDNPWARATGDLFAKLCGDCEKTSGLASANPQFGLSRDNIDESIDKKMNFYLWANGSWMKNNPIPAGYPSWNTFLSLHVKSQEQCKAILETLTSKTDTTEEERKVAAFYAAAMNENAIEQAGMKPLAPLFDLIKTIVTAYTEKRMEEYAKLLGNLASKYGVYAFFSTGVSPDYKNSDHSLLQVSQGGLGLPDRDYYLDDDKEEKRHFYISHIAKMLTLLKDPDAAESTETATGLAKKVFAVETLLAGSHMTKTENRDPIAVHNMMPMSGLDNLGKEAFSFASYFIGSTGKSTESLGNLNVRNMSAVKKVADVASTIDPETLLAYLQWHALHAYAPFLSKVFVQENFDFCETQLSGTKEMKPRWKRAMAFTESALGEAVGKLYCKEHFDESCKERAMKIVELVRAALEERLQEVDWIQSESTRSEALKKMSRFRIKIGYPNKWLDYSKLVFSEKDSFLDMVAKAKGFAHSEQVIEMNSPTDREKWFMTPQTVNAYYHPSLNEIVFPAAILQHPFFDMDADDAINFGAMGAVVGHEMTHGFDDKGRKFNFAGVLHDWWTENDAEEYEKRVEVMVEQANNFEVYGKNVQGKLTSGENIADLGGLRLAYRALKSTDSFDDTKLIDGFTQTQRFFMSWAQCWRQNIEKERSLQLLTLDPHGPNEMRCNCPLSNLPEFHNAFDISSGPMFKSSGTRVDIW
jgi:putative endopeptidase